MRLAASITLLFCALTAARTSAETVDLQAARDNTLYEDAEGALSNGVGSYLFVGVTNQGAVRRALLYFDVADAVPAGATINAASLTLTVSKTPSGEAQVLELHQCQARWGEENSDAGGEEGGGTSAAPGDATWIHSAFSDSPWATPGGDLAAAVTAAAAVGDVGPHTWESDGLVADTQRWLDAPEGNFGWVLLGEEAADRTTKRFNSRENSDGTTRPLLTIDYSIPATPTAVGSSTWGEIKGKTR